MNVIFCYIFEDINLCVLIYLYFLHSTGDRVLSQIALPDPSSSGCWWSLLVRWFSLVYWLLGWWWKRKEDRGQCGSLGIYKNHLLLPPFGPLCYPVPPYWSRGLAPRLSVLWMLCEWRCCNRHSSLQGLDQPRVSPRIRQGLKRLKQHRPKGTWSYSAHRSVEPRWGRATLPQTLLL